MPTHNPADRKGMTEKIDKQNGMSLEKKEGQLVTRGIFYCRDSAEINGCASLQTSSRLDSDVLRSRQQKHTAVRYVQDKIAYTQNTQAPTNSPLSNPYQHNTFLYDIFDI